MLTRINKPGEEGLLPHVPDIRPKAKPQGGFEDVRVAVASMVHDAGRWYIYEVGDVVPDAHRTASEKEAGAK